MDSPYNWVVFLHITGAFAFTLAHGVSAGVALKLRQERDVPRVQALLDLSNMATQGMYVGLVILLIGGSPPPSWRASGAAGGSGPRSRSSSS